MIGTMKTAMLAGMALVATAGAAQAQSPLPRPNLVYTGQQAMTGSDGNPYVRYAFQVTNRDQYPAELFVLNSNLPPCGSNTNASRTWLDMFVSGGTQRLYGYCAMTSRAEMGNIGFQLPAGTAPPASIYITLTDRQTGTTTSSNHTAIPRRVLARPVRARPN